MLYSSTLGAWRGIVEGKKHEITFAVVVIIRFQKNESVFQFSHASRPIGMAKCQHYCFEFYYYVNNFPKFKTFAQIFAE